MRWIFISPHLDDAVLSCGGLIWEQTHQGIPVEIWTVNAGDPQPGPLSDFITLMHAIWKTGSPQETVVQRRMEDREAAVRVGARVRYLNLVDAIYRRNENGELIYTREVFVPIDPQDIGIIEQTAEQIAFGLQEADMLVCPLALGSHVDHVISRRTVETLIPAGRPLWYYADIPYLFTHQNELAPAIDGLVARNTIVSDEGLAAWQAGIEAYASQLDSLFADVDDMRNQIKDYRLSMSGQVLWERMPVV